MAKALSALLLAAGVAVAAPVKIVAPGLSVVDLEPAKATFLLEYLAQAMASEGLRVITQKEIATLLGVEREKALVGCAEESSSCMAELGAALGSECVLLGEIAHFGKRYQFNLKVISARDASPIVSRVGKADSEEDLVDQLATVGKQMGDELRLHFNPPPVGAVALETPARTKRFWWIPAVGGVALAGAGIGVMLGSGVTAKPLADATRAMPLDTHQAAGIRDSANTQMTAGTVLVVTGAAALAIGAGLWLFGGSSPATATAFFGKDGGGVSIAGVFR